MKKNIEVTVLIIVLLMGVLSSCECRIVKHENFSREINKNFEFLSPLEQNITNHKISPTEGFVIRNEVEILTEPNMHSGVLGILNLHDEVEILHAFSNFQESILGRWWKGWYRISFKNIEGYVRTCCVDNRKYLFYINGNSIIVYPRLADGIFDDRNHFPFNLVYRSRRCNVFINGERVTLPAITLGQFLRSGKVINGDLHLIYRTFFDESGTRVIISSEGRGIHISIENYDCHF